MVIPHKKVLMTLLFVLLVGGVYAVTTISDTAIITTGNVTLANLNITENMNITGNITITGNSTIGVGKSAGNTDKNKIVLWDRNNLSQFVQMYYDDEKGLVSVNAGHLEFESFNGEYKFRADSDFNSSDSKLFILNKFGNKSGTLEYSDSNSKLFIGTDNGGIDFIAQNGIVKFAKSGTNNDVYIVSSDGNSNLFFRHDGTNALVRALEGNLRLDSVSGIVQIGDGVTQENITLTSPDGAEHTCGVNNAGVFLCT